MLNRFGNVYDRFAEGNYEERTRNGNAKEGITFDNKVGCLYCETCKQSKPKNKVRAHKGWKCTDCFKAKK